MGKIMHLLFLGLILSAVFALPDHDHNDSSGSNSHEDDSGSHERRGDHGDRYGGAFVKAAAAASASSYN